MQSGVERMLIAAATEVSGTLSVGFWHLLMRMNANSSVGVLSPGIGKTPNQIPMKKRMNLSGPLMILSGLTRFSENHLFNFSNMNLSK